MKFIATFPGRAGRLIWAFSLVLFTGYAQSGDEPLSLVHKGQPACTIVVASHPTPAARLASVELQYHLLKRTGVEVPIRNETSEVQGLRILVGETSFTRGLGLRSGDFKSQEYLVAFRSNTIVLLGRDWEDTEQGRFIWEDQDE